MLHKRLNILLFLKDKNNVDGSFLGQSQMNGSEPPGGGKWSGGGKLVSKKRNDC